MNHISGKFIFENAMKVVEKIGDGWRLPTRKEMRAISNNRDKFPNLEIDKSFYWTDEPKGKYQYVARLAVDYFKQKMFESFTQDKSMKNYVLLVKDKKMATGGGEIGRAHV